MTITKNDKINTDDATKALNTIMQMERTSLQQSMPPIWFGVLMALAMGILIFTIAAGLRDYYVFPIIAIPLILAIRSKKTQVSPKTISLGVTGKTALFSLIVTFLALIAGGRFFMEVYKLTWSPIVAGIIAATLVYLLSVGERRDHLKKINGE